jgi:hypothetical protein
LHEWVEINPTPRGVIWLTPTPPELVPDSYITLAGLCPNLETLHLNLCGRIDTQCMIKWGTAFKSLKEIELDGPFLVRVDGWKTFFTGMGEKLEGFLIKWVCGETRGVEGVVTLTPILTVNNLASTWHALRPWSNTAQTYNASVYPNSVYSTTTGCLSSPS